MAKKADTQLYKNNRPNSLAVRRRQARLVVVILVLIISVGVLLGLSWFLSQPFVVINNVAVSGNSLIASKDILAAAKEVLNGSYLGLFTKSNILLYPEKALQKTLAAAFPAIKNVRANLENWQTLKLTVEEKTPIALWCQTIEAENCFYLDENGLIFAEAATFSENIFVRFISSSVLSIGQSFLPTEEFRSINFFLDALTPLGLVPTIFEINSETYQIFLKSGGKLIINISDDLSTILKNLETILRSENLKEALAHDDTIDYIDLRYGSKVFYKFEN